MISSELDVFEDAIRRAVSRDYHVRRQGCSADPLQGGHALVLHSTVGDIEFEFDLTDRLRRVVLPSWSEQERDLDRVTRERLLDLRKKVESMRRFAFGKLASIVWSALGQIDFLVAELPSLEACGSFSPPRSDAPPVPSCELGPLSETCE